MRRRTGVRESSAPVAPYAGRARLCRALWFFTGYKNTAMKRYDIRDATIDDQVAMVALLPLLADFPIPSWRKPEHLWTGDGELLERHLAGGAPQCFARVGIGDDGRLLGLTLTSLRDELLSSTPSAHLEAIVVAPGARGAGLGRALMDDTEREAARRGARSLTLHVFGRNERARLLYRSCAYDEELIRCIKWLE